MIKLLIAADVIMAAVFAWAFRFLPEQLPIFYSKPWGEAQIADKWYIFLLPVLMHGIFFLNTAVTNKFFSDAPQLKKLMNVANAFFIFSFTGVFLKILFLIT